MIQRMVILSIVLFASVSTALGEREWVLYYESTAKRFAPFTKFYYDKNSIKEVEPNVFEVYHKQSSADGFAYSVSQYWFDCTKKMLAVGQSNTYMGEQELSSTNKFKAGYAPIREPYKGQIIDAQWKLLPIICNR